MLGRTISDPEGVEASGLTEISGMGLLPMDTVFLGEKVQTQAQGNLGIVTGPLSALSGHPYQGYEIHMGRGQEQLPPIQNQGNVYGTYLHGIFDGVGIADTVIRSLCGKKGLDAATLTTFDQDAYKQAQYDLLAKGVREGLDMNLVYKIIHREV